MPRRACVHEDRLFAVSDRSVATFRFEDRDHPAETASLDLSRPAHRIVAVGANIATLANDWWTGEPTLSVLPREGADGVAALGMISLVDLAGGASRSCDYSGWSSW